MRLQQLLRENEPETINRNVSLLPDQIVDGKFPSFLNGVRINAEFHCKDSARLTTLEGGPVYVEQNGEIEFCTALTSLEGAPIEVRSFMSYGCPIISLEGIGKRYLKIVHTEIWLPDTIKLNILGLCLIKGSKIAGHPLIYFDKDDDFRENPKLAIAYNILTKHRTLDLLDVKEELMEHNLKEYAKL